MIGIQSATSDQMAKEALYLNLREAEGRVLPDEAVKQLPLVPSGHTHEQEWRIRANNLKRLLRHLRKSGKSGLNILDLGCGNGWMGARLHDEGYMVTGVDLNMTELEQAERVFGTSESLQWMYGDVFRDELPTAPYDVIILGASCQYFPDIETLTERLLSLLKPRGEIHLYDSVFYQATKIAEARKRSLDYYTKLGYPEMIPFYFHHSEEQLRRNGYKKVNSGLFQRKNPLSWWLLRFAEPGWRSSK